MKTREQMKMFQPASPSGNLRQRSFVPSSVRSKACLALLLMIAGAVACSKKKPAPRVPAAPSAEAPHIGWTERGIASWYGNPYHGRATASGEIYDMEQFTAAHRTLPFGAIVRVASQTNGKRVEVRINDRGPFFDSRVIDLSRAAARAINLIGPGTAPVQVELIGYASAPSSNAFYCAQAVRFFERKEAERIRERLLRKHQSVELYARQSSGDEWIVRVGRVASETAAAAIAEAIRDAVGSAQVVRIERPPTH